MLAALAVVAAVTAVPADPALSAKLDRWLVAADFRGSVLVSKGGAVLLRKGYGMADRENGVAYDADTVFDVGSITKQFTAGAILKLEMQGKLHVEDTIAKYFPIPAHRIQGVAPHGTVVMRQPRRAGAVGGGRGDWEVPSEVMGSGTGATRRWSRDDR